MLKACVVTCRCRRIALMVSFVLVVGGSKLHGHQGSGECLASTIPVYLSVVRGATIFGLTGSAAGIAGADTNPAHYGQYNAPGGIGGGYGLIGGPLLDDTQAASFVKPTQKS